MSQTDAMPGSDSETFERVWGKYRGIVLNNVDPNGQGRLMATVAEVLGEIPTGWATPCVPSAGPVSGFYSIPPIGAGVWIEFESGDISRPIWSGCYWGLGEAPTVPPSPPGIPNVPTTKIWRSDLGLTTAYDDLTQSITITDVLGLNSIVVDVPTGTVTVKGLVRVVLDGNLVQLGSQAAFHPAVYGDLLLAYLGEMIALFNTHVHPGELALGILPVTPAPPVGQIPPPVGLISTTVLLD